MPAVGCRHTACGAWCQVFCRVKNKNKNKCFFALSGVLSVCMQQLLLLCVVSSSRVAVAVSATLLCCHVPSCNFIFCRHFSFGHCPQPDSCGHCRHIRPAAAPSSLRTLPHLFVPTPLQTPPVKERHHTLLLLRGQDTARKKKINVTAEKIHPFRSWNASPTLSQSSSCSNPTGLFC